MFEETHETKFVYENKHGIKRNVETNNRYV